jgi:F-type H+-transporting ATPase subunit b
MRALPAAAAVALSLLLLAPEVFAAGGGSEAEAHGPNWTMLFFQVLNAVILAVVLVKFAGPALRNYFQQRSSDIRQAIEGAQDQLREAEAEIAELRARLASFDGEAEGLVAGVAEAAQAEGARVKQRAEATAERIREDARRVADSEIERARQALRAEAARLAIEIAADTLRDQTTPEDDERLVREFTDKIGGSA